MAVGFRHRRQRPGQGHAAISVQPPLNFDFGEATVAEPALDAPYPGGAASCGTDDESRDSSRRRFAQDTHGPKSDSEGKRCAGIGVVKV